MWVKSKIKPENKPTDPTAIRLYQEAAKKDPLAFAENKSILTSSDGFPVEGELERLGLCISGFRFPTLNDYYVNHCGRIVQHHETRWSLDNRSLDNNPTLAGHRFILAAKASAPEPT